MLDVNAEICFNRVSRNRLPNLQNIIIFNKRTSLHHYRTSKVELIGQPAEKSGNENFEVSS